MTTYGDFFSGFGGMTIGARAAGFDVLFGVEYDKDLAAVYRANLGDHVIVADVTTLNMADLPRVDVFHASPPCTNASVANANGGESPQDLAMAKAVCRYIMAKQPDIVTLENVYQYRNFESWHEIARTLLSEGYTYNYWHVNMANYGVPQTRRRMIAVARRDEKTPQLPEKTHAENPTPGLFSTKARWVSWYEAIEDLIPTLPDSEFAKWQLERLPDEFRNLYLSKDKGDYSAGHAHENEPAVTVTANDYGRRRAFIVNGENAGQVWGNKFRTDDPAYVVTGNSPRAFIVDGDASGNRPPTVSDINSPCTTVKTNGGGRVFRAATNGRVVKMTPRALARFQSFPDWYELPGSNRLAVKGIGNAVPPLFAEKLYKGME